MRQSRIILGVTGGISAYRIPDLAGALIKNGHEIKIVMTENAKKFITPLTLATLGQSPVYDDTSEWTPDGVIKHIHLAKWLENDLRIVALSTKPSLDMLVIVPATANTIVKMSCGIADNLLTSLYAALSSKTRVMIFPAMNTKMWDNMNTRDALQKLRLRRAHEVISPEEGLLACGDYGMGKLPSVRKIVSEIEKYEKYSVVENEKGAP